jgi:hypothetical protein
MQCVYRFKRKQALQVEKGLEKQQPDMSVVIRGREFGV